MATINYRSWLLQVRIDAYKYTTQIRRPKAQKVENIGAWLGILKVITFTAVVLNVRPTKYLSIYINLSCQLLSIRAGNEYSRSFTFTEKNL